jgi:hypothetical protein
MGFDVTTRLGTSAAPLRSAGDLSSRPCPGELNGDLDYAAAGSITWETASALSLQER